MAKKEWTEEERKAFGEKMRAAKAKKAAEKKEVNQAVPTASPEPETETVQTDPAVEALLKRIEELEQRQFFPQPTQQPTQQYQTRSVTKFSVKAKDYPDPRPRLFKEEKLIRKNFIPDWYILEWRVQKVDYDKDNVHYTEPRFEVELWRIKEDEAGEPSNKKFRIATGMFFEDPDSFVQVANLKGIEVPESLHKEFADEMRYLTIRDWLLECFYPPRILKTNNIVTGKQIGRAHV